MSYQDYINTNPSTVVYDFAEANLIEIERDGDTTIKYSAYYSRLKNSKLQIKVRDFLTKQNVAFMYSIVKSVEKGCKILKPGMLDFQLLELTDLNLKLEDYNQPFETVVLEYPEEYANVRRFEGSKPRYLIITHLKSENIIVLTLIGEGTLATNISLSQNHLTIEEQLAAKQRLHGKVEDHWEIIRAGLNATLVMDEYGVKRVGPEDPAYFQRLQNLKSKGRRAEETIRKQKARHPVLYAFNSEVVLCNRTVLESETGAAGTPKRPHFRRGYYRTQHYGVHNSERKRIRIPPCFVNSKLFVGDIRQDIRTYISKSNQVER